MLTPERFAVGDYGVATATPSRLLSRLRGATVLWMWSLRTQEINIDGGWGPGFAD